MQDTRIERVIKALSFMSGQYNLAVPARRQSIIGEPVIPAGERHCDKGKRPLHQIDRVNRVWLEQGTGRPVRWSIFYVTLVRRGSRKLRGNRVLSEDVGLAL